MKVALIERKLVGGTCVNTGCMPTKTLVASAYAAHMARRATDFGVTAGPVGIDMKVVEARARQVILNARHRNERWLEGMERLTFLQGHARFTGPATLAVDGEELTAPRVFLNVGARARIPEIAGIATVPYLDNTDMVGLDRVPEHLVVVGGSYIGLEFAQMYRRFGSQVTVVERDERLISREDEDVCEAIREILESEGITVRTGANCIALASYGKGVTVSVDCVQGAPVIQGSDLLLAAGRQPNTDDLALDKAGVATDARGFITVDDKLETSVPGIWALGDCNGRGAFTHTAYNDFEIVAANLLDGEDRRLSQRIPGYALYIDPPLGRVGMSETEARKTGRKILISVRPMTRVGRAIEKGETKGFMKIVADAETNRIVGAAILGTGGDEAIHGLIDMMSAGQPVSALRWAVPVHPTVSELIPTILLGLKEPSP
jgi:pyruvate/2-oxoglutarate dehydrogenase complex dihydrolipoamide dehydrogenase (E3) component